MLEHDPPFNFLVLDPLVLLSAVRCWRCHRSTRVISLAGLDDDNQVGTIVGVRLVDPPLLAILERDYPFFRLSVSRTTGERAFYNHCEHCQALQGDHYLHASPDGPFFAIGEQEPAPVVISLGDGCCVFADPLPYAGLGTPLTDEDADDEEDENT